LNKQIIDDPSEIVKAYAIKINYALKEIFLECIKSNILFNIEDLIMEFCDKFYVPNIPAKLLILEWIELINSVNKSPLYSILHLFIKEMVIIGSENTEASEKCKQILSQIFHKLK